MGALIQPPYQEPVFNVKTYGARGDARTVTDAVTTNGSAIITSATAAFSASDVGKYVAVRNGAATAALVGTVASVTNATTIVASGNAGATLASATLELATDDTVAIQAALTALGAARRGTCFFPPGTYLYSAAMGLFGASDADPVRQALITGSKGATLLHKQGVFINGSYGAGTTTPNGAVFVVNFADNVTVRDLTFQGPAQNNAGILESVVHLTGFAKNGRIENCYVFDHYRGIALDYSGTDKGWIVNNLIRNCNAAIQQSSGAGSAVVTGNQVVAPANNLGGASAQIYVAGNYTRVANNYIETNTTATAPGIQSDTTLKRHVIANNTIIGKGTGAVGIQLNGTGGVGTTITGNTLETCNVGIQLAGNGHTISGNAISGAGASSIGIALYVGSTPANGCAVAGNSLRTLTTGITANSLLSDRITLTGNVFASDVTTPTVTTGWTNSRASANTGVTDF